jgi:DNA processing protein
VSPGPETAPGAEAAALVALLRAGRRHPTDYANLVDEAGGAQAILEEEHGLLAGELLESAAAEIASWSQAGMRLVTLLDPDYPANLHAVHDRPPLLFLAGRLEPRDEQSVAVIGSRRPSQAGLQRARAIAEHLLTAGYTIVSGLAAGIDTAAHETALQRDTRTLAVIGTGLRHSYPPQNAALQRRIAAQGAVISQFWPDTGPSRLTFPLRNAVMSGLSLATVIVEATQSSGARIQARLALGHGRPVLLPRPLLEQSWARDLAQRPGTHVIDSLTEVAAVVKRLSSTDTLVV